MRFVFLIVGVAIILTAGVAWFVSREDGSRTMGKPELSSAERGKFVFRRCQACHAIGDNKKLTGPGLAGVINRPSGSIEGYRYSNAMAALSVIWDEKTLTEFLTKPRAFVPGTKMGFGGIKKPQKIQDLLAYLVAEGGLHDAEATQ